MHLLFVILLLLGTPVARAGDCWNADGAGEECGDGFDRGSSEDSSAPPVPVPFGADALLSNPAGLPVGPSPFGLEGFWHDRSYSKGKPKFTVSTVKGFDGMGLGVGSYAQGSFLSPDFRDHYLASSYRAEFSDFESNSTDPFGLRLGTAFLIPTGTDVVSLRLGGSVGLGNVVKSPSRQIGAVVKIVYLAFGYSTSFERLSTALPPSRVDMMSVAAMYKSIFLAYAEETVRSSVNRTKSKLYGGRFQGKEWIFYAAFRSYRGHEGRNHLWPLYSAEYQVSNFLHLSYIYGVFPHSNSFGTKFFF